MLKISPWKPQQTAENLPSPISEPRGLNGLSNAAAPCKTPLTTNSQQRTGLRALAHVQPTQLRCLPLSSPCWRAGTGGEQQGHSTHLHHLSCASLCWQYQQCSNAPSGCNSSHPKVATCILRGPWTHSLLCASSDVLSCSKHRLRVRPLLQPFRYKNPTKQRSLQTKVIWTRELRCCDAKLPASFSACIF